MAEAVKWAARRYYSLKNSRRKRYFTFIHQKLTIVQLLKVSWALAGAFFEQLDSDKFGELSWNPYVLADGLYTLHNTG